MKIKNVKFEPRKNYNLFDCKVEFDYKKYFWSTPIKMTCFKCVNEEYFWYELKTGKPCSDKLSFLLYKEYDNFKSIQKNLDKSK